MNTFYRIFIFSIICFVTISLSAPVLAVQNPTANAGPDLYTTSGQTITLQGSAYDPQGSSLAHYWNCTGGTLSSYSIAQPIYTAPTTSTQTSYICSLTATNTYSLSSSDTMNIYVNSSNSTGYSLGLILPNSLSVSKKVINLTSGNLNWQNIASAKPGDVLSFAITLQAGNQDIHNVNVQDILPAGLIYKGNLMVNASLNYSGNPATGINIGTIPANGVAVVAFQAYVASSTSFVFGNTTLINNATVTSTEAGTQTTSASVLVNNSAVYGATTISTGTTNYFLADSYLLPMFLIVLMSWLYFTGRIYRFSDWLKQKI